MNDETYAQARVQCAAEKGELWVGLKFLLVSIDWLLARGFSKADLRALVSNYVREPERFQKSGL